MNLTDTPHLVLAAAITDLNPIYIGGIVLGLIALFIFFMIFNAARVLAFILS